MFDEEKLKEIANDYGTGLQVIKQYYETLMSYPFVIGGEEDYLYECIVALITERSKTDETSEHGAYLDSVERSVYRIYGDDAIPYLSKAFKEKNGIEDEEIDE